MPAVLLTTLDVRWQCESDPARIATADIQHVAHGELTHIADGLATRRFQISGPFATNAALANVLIVGLALASTVLADLEGQQQAAVAEQRAADAGAERQHAFQALALHHPETLHGRIV